jgi:DNA-binding MarR family transcriptional regulator
MTAALVLASKLERARRDVIRSRDSLDRRHYFECIAEARFVLRKVFRIVEEEAKAAGLDPLAHQALLQIYGTPQALRIKELAERLDISPAFASVVAKKLHRSGLISSVRSITDQRASRLTITKAGRTLLHAIDDRVQEHVRYFTQQLTAPQKERAVAILMFYVGLSVKNATQARRSR